MAKDMFWTTVTFSIIICVLALAFWPADMRHVTVKYDCGIAEISPDYPVAVKEQCRKLQGKTQ
jgi:hypothetical protein